MRNKTFDELTDDEMITFRIGDIRKRDAQLAQLRAELEAAKHTGDASSAQLGLMDGMINEAFAPDPEADRIRHSCLKFLWGEASSKKLTGPQVKAMLDWLKPTKDDGGAYTIDPMASQELHAVWTAANIADGQGSLI
jgi:hypothetical protein